ncbi:MAG: hypothetical protein CMK09_08405 [Ponticaulis sp.]|nr:hypothetical protein [Ponticaulis sp.]|tara:strand:- start:7240 stop:7689 length:450 start_codon:yes stop_codon:yes gene_type:complete
MTYVSQTLSALIAAPLLLAAVTSAQPVHADDAAKLSVTVQNVEKPQGKMMIAVFKDEAGYDGSQPVAASAAPVSAETVTAVFSDLEPGEYGIKIYHDVNDDGEMNTNPFGMPTEPFGFSNDAPVRFGPPGWNAAKFTLEGETVQTITLQ